LRLGSTCNLSFASVECVWRITSQVAAFAVCSYETLIAEASALNRIQWEVLVVDEVRHASPLKG